MRGPGDVLLGRIRLAHRLTLGQRRLARAQIVGLVCEPEILDALRSIPLTQPGRVSDFYGNAIALRYDAHGTVTIRMHGTTTTAMLADVPSPTRPTVRACLRCGQPVLAKERAYCSEACTRAAQRARHADRPLHV